LLGIQLLHVCNTEMFVAPSREYFITERFKSFLLTDIF